MGRAFFSKPWRDTENYQKDFDFVKSYKPRNQDVKHLRILLHGPVGAGKSSFYNSVESLLKGRVVGRAPTNTNTGKSFTLKYKAYTIQKDPDSFYPFIFNDTMGFEEKTNNGVHVEDVKLAMRGHVPDGYKFNPEVQFQETDPGYKEHPTLDDRVHVLVCVMAAGLVSLTSDDVWKKMREVRLAASEMGIPQLAILTKVDEAFPEVKTNIDKGYKHKCLKQKVDEFSMSLGIQPNCIFLVKNYQSETNVNADINALILSALKWMVTSGEDYLNNL
ncbi:interferon-induced protein 44-like [Clinocottus analis]|uniref:interferon-induced protein 44-like n=1 Tax=Clinocottus analis TaxID=304258 RepID=UPI0035C0F2B1